jgi:hypothetical protein
LVLLDLFITSLVIFTGLLVALAAPLFYVTWRKDRLTTARNFAISALVVAICCAVLAVVSERQVSQCLDAGNSDCIDSGAAGMQLLFVVIFTAISWFIAYFMWRD